MNGLFGKLQMSAPQALAPDVAAAMGGELPPQPVQAPPQPMAAPPAQNMPQAMSPEQSATSAWLQQQQPQYKYSVGDPHVDKYINMFIGN